MDAIAALDGKTGGIILKVVNFSAHAQNTLVRLPGAGPIAPEGTATVLASQNPEDENSAGEPLKVSPLYAEGDWARREFPLHIPPELPHDQADWSSRGGSGDCGARSRSQSRNPGRCGCDRDDGRIRQRQRLSRPLGGPRNFRRLPGLLSGFIRQGQASLWTSRSSMSNLKIFADRGFRCCSRYSHAALPAAPPALPVRGRHDNDRPAEPVRPAFRAEWHHLVTQFVMRMPATPGSDVSMFLPRPTSARSNTTWGRIGAI